AAACNVLEASLVDIALDMGQPAVICIRVLTRRNREFSLSNPIPEVWSADEIRDGMLNYDNTVVCLHNRTTPSEYTIACRGVHCQLSIRKIDAIRRCSFILDEMMLVINVYCIASALITVAFFSAVCHYEDKALPR
ncbi:hypothetical protein PMAYCL1PPCAC_14312, partial [Pristionchus mayeri]